MPKVEPTIVRSDTGNTPSWLAQQHKFVTPPRRGTYSLHGACGWAKALRGRLHARKVITIPTDRVFMNGAKKSCFNRTDSNTHSLEPVPVSIRELKASWFSANSRTCRSIKGPSDTPTSGSVELCHRLRCGHTLCVGLTKYDWLRQPVGALHRTVTHVLSQATLGAGLKA